MGNYLVKQSSSYLWKLTGFQTVILTMRRDFMRILGQNCFSQNQNHVGLQGTLISFQQTDYIYIKISCVHLNTILLTTSSQLFFIFVLYI